MDEPTDFKIVEAENGDTLLRCGGCQFTFAVPTDYAASHTGMPFGCPGCGEPSALPRVWVAA